MTQAIDYAAIGKQAAQGEDQTKMKAGGFDRSIPKEGICTVRLLQYIETGFHKGKNPKFPKPSQQVMLRFEVNNKKNLIELPQEDGSVKLVPNTIDITLPKGGATSRYGRLFKALNYSGRFNHFAEMVGVGAWKASVTHNKVGEGEDEKTYANLDKDKAWTFAAPTFQQADPETGEPVGDILQMPVAELDGEPKVFLYENAGIPDTDYISLWDSLFIEGEHEATEGKPAKSKNWIQERIMASLKFPDSRLATLIGSGSAAELADLEDLPVGDTPGKSVTGVEEPSDPTDAVTKDSIAKSAATTPVDDDPLADLGL